MEYQLPLLQWLIMKVKISWQDLNTIQMMNYLDKKDIFQNLLFSKVKLKGLKWLKSLIKNKKQIDLKDIAMNTVKMLKLIQMDLTK